MNDPVQDIDSLVVKRVPFELQTLHAPPSPQDAIVRHPRRRGGGQCEAVHRPAPGGFAGSTHCLDAVVLRLLSAFGLIGNLGNIMVGSG